MSSPLPFVPFGTPLRLSPKQGSLLTIAIMQAIKQSVENISLAEVGTAAFELVSGVVKGKFGILAEIPGLVIAICYRNWDAVLSIIYNRLADLAGIDDLIAMAEAIKTVDNGRASVALMKNMTYKECLNKLD